MKVLLAIFIVLGITAQVSRVNAVICNDVSECVKTDYTTATCEENMCKCAKNYYPTNEGCIAKPMKPTVDVSASNTAEALEGAMVSLTCSSKMEDPLFTYKWWVNGEVATTAATKSAVFFMGAEDMKFKCSVALATVESDPSDELLVKALPLGGTSAAKPTITLPSPGVAEGRHFLPKCTGYPYGLQKVTFKDENDEDLVLPVLQPSDVSGKKIKCLFEYKNITFSAKPAVINYPKIITTFDSVSIMSSPAITAPTAFKLRDAPKLTCHVSPPKKYLPKDIVIEYMWSWDNVTTRILQLEKVEGEYEGITCTATNLANSKTSKALPMITVNDNYLAKPKVHITPARPAVTSHMTLTCVTDEKDAQITWMSGNKVIPGQKDTSIQYGDLKKTGGFYSCSVTKDGFTAQSDDFRVNVQEQLAKPIITGTKEVGKWGEMKLECTSASAVPAMTYTWAKTGKMIEQATESTYMIEEMENKNAGKYSCTTKFAELAPQTSEELEVKVVTPGVQCTTDADCDGKQTSLTGKCDTKTERCVCASKYYARGNECGNGVAQMAASLAVVLMASLVARLF